LLTNVPLGSLRVAPVRYDGGQKINRDGVRIWVETYYCSVCGRRVDVREEVLD
jgi:hypothetical protein